MNCQSQWAVLYPSQIVQPSNKIVKSLRTKTISAERAALHEALWKSVILRRVEKVNTHASHFCSTPPVLLGSLFSTIISKSHWFPMRRQSEWHCSEVWSSTKGSEWFVLQEFPYLIHCTWASISFMTQKSPQVPKQRRFWQRKQMKKKKGSIWRHVLQVRENSGKQNSKIWSWDGYWVEYFPLFSRRQQLLFSVKNLIDYWAVNNVQFYLHPLFGLFWSLR